MSILGTWVVGLAYQSVQLYRQRFRVIPLISTVVGGLEHIIPLKYLIWAKNPRAKIFASLLDAQWLHYRQCQDVQNLWATCTSSDIKTLDGQVLRSFLRLNISPAHLAGKAGGAWCRDQSQVSKRTLMDKHYWNWIIKSYKPLKISFVAAMDGDFRFCQRYSCFEMAKMDNSNQYDARYLEVFGIIFYWGSFGCRVKAWSKNARKRVLVTLQQQDWIADQLAASRH